MNKEHIVIQYIAQKSINEIHTTMDSLRIQEDPRLEANKGKVTFDDAIADLARLRHSMTYIHLLMVDILEQIEELS